jgi:LysM repeat protein
MSSTLSDEESAIAELGARGRHAATRSRLRARLLAAHGHLKTSLGRSTAAPAGEDRTTRRSRPAPEAPGRSSEGTIEVVVAEGESVQDIAARHGVSTASLLARNGLGWHTPLTAGAVLLVRPGPQRVVPASGAAEELHRHRVASGDTVSAIAERHGVSTAAVLLANGLSRGSAVHAGQQLVIPVPNLRRSGSDAVTLTGPMRANATAVVTVGRELGVPEDGLVVALAAAMQDSSLHNLAFGEADAVGLFQQRPSDGWGDEAALLDPRRAARAFFGGPGSAVVAPATGLLDVGGWEFMSIGEAAHAVQRSSSPAAYGKWERCAREWLQELEKPVPVH